MSSASDKAQFYLEQAIPQLQEFEQKKIFTKVRALFLFWATQNPTLHPKFTDESILE
jgi:hypothetical protein